MNEIIEWYLQPFKKYADFSGRARRKEYWSFALGHFLISLVLGGAGFGIGLGSEYLGSLFGLFILIPSIAVGVRRLHDTGQLGLVAADQFRTYYRILCAALLLAIGRWICIQPIRFKSEGTGLII